MMLTTSVKLFFMLSLGAISLWIGSCQGSSNNLVDYNSLGKGNGSDVYLENTVSCLNKSIRYRKRPMSETRVAVQVTILNITKQRSHVLFLIECRSVQSISSCLFVCITKVEWLNFCLETYQDFPYNPGVTISKH